jgi:hypothetical protein
LRRCRDGRERQASTVQTDSCRCILRCSPRVRSPSSS